MDNITKMAEMLRAQVEQELAEAYTLSDIEKVTRRVVQEVGRRAIAMTVASVEEPYAAPEVPCPSCGQRLPYLRRRSAQLRTLLGRIQVQRAYYLCGACHRGYFPLDEQLELRPNALSAELERLSAMTGALLPFGRGRDLFEALTLVSLSDQTLDKATQAYGTAAMQRE